MAAPAEDALAAEAALAEEIVLAAEAAVAEGVALAAEHDLAAPAAGDALAAEHDLAADAAPGEGDALAAEADLAAEAARPEEVALAAEGGLVAAAVAGRDADPVLRHSAPGVAVPSRPGLVPVVPLVARPAGPPAARDPTVPVAASSYSLLNPHLDVEN
jgi:hypothetical protein